MVIFLGLGWNCFCFGFSLAAEMILKLKGAETKMVEVVFAIAVLLVVVVESVAFFLAGCEAGGEQCFACMGVTTAGVSIGFEA